MKGNSKLKPDGFCDEVEISSWKFYFSTSWMFSKSDIFYTGSYNKSRAFLYVSTYAKYKYHSSLIFDDDDDDDDDDNDNDDDDVCKHTGDVQSSN